MASFYKGIYLIINNNQNVAKIKKKKIITNKTKYITSILLFNNSFIKKKTYK